MAVPSGADEGAALAVVRRHLDPSVEAVEVVGEGEWSRCFAFSSQGRELVVRLGAHRVDFEKDRLAATWAGPDLPVPQVLGLGDGWCLSTRVRGVPLEQLDAAGWERVLPAVLRLLDAMAAVEVDERAGAGIWDGRGVGPCATWAEHLLTVAVDDPGSRIHGWSRALGEHPRAAAQHRRGLAALAEVAPALHPPTGLVHADLVNRNVTVEDDRITGVFDWGCALWGDPLHEIAWLDTWTPWHPAIAEVRFRERALAHLADAGADLTDADARIRACQLHVLVDALGYSTRLGRHDDVAGIGARLDEVIEQG